jgi:hypothetical protein
MIDKKNYPNGCFLKSVKVFFKTKSTDNDGAVKLSIVNTLNGYPSGQTLDYSTVTVYPADIKVSETPHYLDETTSTTFTFSAPVYVQAGVLYAFILQTNTNKCEAWGVTLGDDALKSTTKNLPTDPTPSANTIVSSAPYIGSLFLSQNALTWTADQNSCLMFILERCVFNTSATPNIQFVVPKKLPEITLVADAIDHFANANTLTSATLPISNNKIVVDAFNVTTSDFIPTGGSINYTYSSTLVDGTQTAATNITPGKYGTAMNQDILLADGKGSRILDPNTHVSFSLYAQMSTADDAISPMVSDSALSTYAIRNIINDCEMSNGVITLVSGGTGYNANTTSVTISAPTGTGGVQATAKANVVGGVVQSVYVTYAGSGYVETPTITITDSSSPPGSGASVTVLGETSSHGGTAVAKYVTKKISLDVANESGDLNVYLTAYRPVGTNIHVYYKIQNNNDTQVFEDGNWQLMTMVRNTSTLFSANRSDLYEYVFAPGTGGVDQGYVTYTSTTGKKYTSFNQFAIKIVMRTNDNTLVPFIKDFRTIALPTNVNTSV